MHKIVKNRVNSVPLLDVGRDHRQLKAEMMEAIAEIIDSGQFIGGPHCKNLERRVAEICQTEFAIGCASGSDALLLALIACDVGPGDEVICPSFTFFATASAVERLGATPIFVDIDPVSFNLDPSLIKTLITNRTRAIIPVHLFGQCCDMDPIMDLARERNLWVIEDAAQAIGANYHGKPAGSIGDVGCFSFYPTKNLGGMGDGGMLTSNDPDLADRISLLANHGMRPRYHHQEIGINSRLDAIQAAVLGIKIQQLGQWTRARAENARTYCQLFSEIGLTDEIMLPEMVHDNSVHAWNQFTVRIPDGRRDSIRQHLADVQVGTEVYYPIPLHLQKCFDHLCYETGSLPVSEQAAAEVLSLPIFPELTWAEINCVVQCLATAMASQQVSLRKAS